ncbi:MAG TPA: chloride channel protein [Thermoanaerobaculia bacterium]
MTVSDLASRVREAAPHAGRLLAAGVSQIRFLAGRFLLVTLVLVGALCGVLAVLFHRYVELARDLLIGRALEQPGWLRVVLVLATPAIVFALLAWLIGRLAPRAIGANLARVRRAYNEDPHLLGARTVGATFVATPLSLGAGAPLGPEGPIVVVTSGVSVGLARLLHLPRKAVRAMIPIGTAAGISAIFNTPITGVVFALEEVIGTSQRGILGGVLVGSVAAAVVERMLLGGRPLLAAPFSTWTDPREFLGFAVVGIIAGITSGLAIALAHRLKRRWSAAMPSTVKRAAVAGLLIGAAGLLAPEILGVGYDSVSFWLHGGGSTTDTGIAFAVKLLAFILAISAGIIGGTFAPSLFIGTALGAAIGQGALQLFPEMNIDPKAYAILGMGSFFAGLMRSPIAAVLIVVELTRDYELIVPLMLGVSLAVAVSRRISRLSVVEQQMIDEGSIEEPEGNDPLAGIRVAETMTTDLVTILRDATAAETARRISGTRFMFYPVVQEDGRLEGVVSRVAIEEAARTDRAQDPVRTLAEEPRLVAASGELIVDVVRQMHVRGVDRCPVIDGPLSRRVIGFLSPSDILRIRIRDARDPEEAFELFE